MPKHFGAQAQREEFSVALESLCLLPKASLSGQTLSCFSLILKLQMFVLPYKQNKTEKVCLKNKKMRQIEFNKSKMSSQIP